MTVGDFVADVAAQVASTGLPGVLVGHSLGGAVAFELLLQPPWAMAGAVLLEASMGNILLKGGHNELHNDYRTVNSAFIDAVRQGRPNPAALVIDDVSGAGAWDRLDEGVRRALNRTAAVSARDSAAFIDRYFSEAELASIKVPVVACYGTETAEVLRTCAATLAATLPDCELVAIEGADHYLASSHPARVAEVVCALLADMRRSRLE